MAGYTRQSVADIINGLDITAPPLNSEFNQLAAAFVGASGHSHDGTDGNAPKIDLTTSVDGYLPEEHGGVGGLNKTDATTNPTVTNDNTQGYAPGSLWLNNSTGRVFLCVGNSTGAAVWREVAQITENDVFFPETNDSVDLGTTALRFRNLFLSGGLTMSGNAGIGGTLSVTGQITASAGVAGNLTGNVTGDLTGNVTAASGSSTFNDITVNGQADFTNTQLQNVSDPTLADHAATKNYVDTQINNLIGGAPSTLDTLNEIAASLNDDASAYSTLDTKIDTKVNKAGDTMSGNLAMGSNKVTGLAAPTVGTDAVNLSYVTALFGSTSSAAVSAQLAEDYAEKAEDSEVETGKFSAKHHAAKALASETAAATSESNAASSAANASTSETNAANSASAASTSETNAASSASAASTSETNAAASESAAATSETNAATSETNASNSSSAAATSETNAANSASAAATSETNAASSASAAATSASNAAASFDAFDDRYLGAKSSDPATDNDGNPLITGALYFDSTNNVTKVYNGSDWQAASSSIDGIKSSFVYTATASQTTFSGSDDNTNTMVMDRADLVSVFLNGVRLTQDTDYTLNISTNTITLTTGASAGDILEAEIFGNLAGQSGAAVGITGGTIDGTVIGGTTPAAISGTTGTFSGTLRQNAALPFYIMMETDFTDNNTQFIQTEGQLRIRTVNDALTASTERFRIDHATGDISFYEDTGTTPKFFWDASAEALGIGTSSPVDKLEIEDSVDAPLRLLIGNNSATSSATTEIKLTPVGNNFSIISYPDADASNANRTDFYSAAGGSYFTFSPSASEAMRIDSSGNLLVGKTGATFSTTGGSLYAGYLSITRDSAEVQAINRLGTDGAVVSFYKASSFVGSISVTSSTTAYNTSSDYRLKEDVQPVVGASDRVLALKPVNFAWKTDGSRVDGFLAHEAQEVVPEAVTGTKDAVDEEGNPEYQGIDQSKLVPVLTAALQEALSRIETLEVEVAALKGI